MLPVDEIFQPLQRELTNNNRVILQAPPGAGKSTRLPLLLLESGQYSTDKQIIILEPRRVAARQIANYLASQLNEKIGQRIGLSMRGENRVSSNTVITIVTDGVMVKKIQADPELTNISLVIFDEFHERALQTDLALALCLDAQELSEALRLLIMSATIDIEALSTQLSAPIVSSTGRQFPVDVEYISANLIPSHDEIAKAIIYAAAKHPSSILVFLAGINDINRVASLLQGQLDNTTDCFLLHGRLPLEQQQMAITPSKDGRRKVVLATNVAQTSLTIEGVDVVIDSGIEKIIYSQPKSGIEQLITQPISLASAEQRAGRAGRLRPGFCYRLGAKEHYERRRRFDVAEIERVNIAQLVFEVYLWGATFDQLFWLTRPEQPSIERACRMLASLGYLQGAGNDWSISSEAKRYAEYGADLRGFRMLRFAQLVENDEVCSEADKHSIQVTACVLVAFLEDKLSALKSNQADVHQILLALTAHQKNQLLTFATQYGRRIGLSSFDWGAFDDSYIGFLMAVAYPDQIAKKVAKRWKLSGGSAVEFHGTEIEPRHNLIVVCAINATKHANYVAQYVELDLDQLKRYLPQLLEDHTALTWSESKQQPTSLKQLKIGELILSSQPTAIELNPERWQQLWMDYIQEKGLQVLGWGKGDVVSLTNRLAFAREFGPPNDWPDWQEEWLLNSMEQWLSPYLVDVRSLKQLKKINLEKILLQSLDWALQQELNELCPEIYETPAGHKRRLDYTGDVPKLSVKLQEMFGSPTNPSICHGNQPILIELLSPAQRPLQVTEDLANFWQNAYIEVKKEMKGRYPKHPWPDNPTEFQATTKVKRLL